ncbi:hypothetical protein PENTCL1PPCAC_23829, partial [Pristionchus entomophagus]
GVIYPSYKYMNMKVKSAEFLLKLGDRFLIKYVIEHSENILTTSPFYSDDQSRIAAVIGLYGMKKHLDLIPRVDFTDSNEPRHDVALMIDGERIYVSKQYLSLHSPVFNAMFYGDLTAKDKGEFELKDVNREEFLEMLHAIYPSCKKITVDSAEYLLELGVRFEITYLIERAEEFLTISDEISIPEKIKIADKFKLDGLEGNAINQIKTIQQAKGIKVF